MHPYLDKFFISLFMGKKFFMHYLCYWNSERSFSLPQILICEIDSGLQSRQNENTIRSYHLQTCGLR